MAENGRPKAEKKATANAARKPLGPIEMFVLYPEGTDPEEIKLVKSKREITDMLLTNRGLLVKKFSFERTPRNTDGA